MLFYFLIFVLSYFRAFVIYLVLSLPRRRFDTLIRQSMDEPC
jgi:hypothetical protein